MDVRCIRGWRRQRCVECLVRELVVSAARDGRDCEYARSTRSKHRVSDGARRHRLRDDSASRGDRSWIIRSQSRLHREQLRLAAQDVAAPHVLRSMRRSLTVLIAFAGCNGSSSVRFPGASFCRSGWTTRWVPSRGSEIWSPTSRPVRVDASGTIALLEVPDPTKAGFAMVTEARTINAVAMWREELRSRTIASKPLSTARMAPARSSCRCFLVANTRRHSTSTTAAASSAPQPPATVRSVR